MDSNPAPDWCLGGILWTSMWTKASWFVEYAAIFEGAWLKIMAEPIRFFPPQEPGEWGKLRKSVKGRYMWVYVWKGYDNLDRPDMSQN